MANITRLAGQKHSKPGQAEPGAPAPSFYGFDCGPGNVLMDLWCAQHRHEPYDHEGRWAASGRCHPTLLNALLAEPWLKLPPPKSTGRDLFNAPWLQQKLSTLSLHSVSAADIQATLLEYTTRNIIDALVQWAPDTQTLIICGGGDLNSQLMRRFKQQAEHQLGATDHSIAEFVVQYTYHVDFDFAYIAFI